MTAHFFNSAHPVLLISPFIENSARHPLPFMVYLGVAGLQLKQWTWWMWYRRQVYQNPSNFLPLAGGYLLGRFLKNHQILLIAAKMVLIIERIEECRAILQTIQNDWRLLKNTFIRRGFYIDFEKGTPLVLKCQSLKEKVQTELHHWRSFIRRLMDICLRIFLHFTRLSLTLWDTYECLYSKKEAIQEIFVNGFKWAELFEKNKHHYLRKLEQNKEMLQHLFHALQIEESEVDTILKRSKKVLALTSQTAQLIRKSGRWLDELAAPLEETKRLQKMQLIGPQKRVLSTCQKRKSLSIFSKKK